PPRKMPSRSASTMTAAVAPYPPSFRPPARRSRARRVTVNRQGGDHEHFRLCVHRGGSGGVPERVVAGLSLRETPVPTVHPVRDRTPTRILPSSRETGPQLVAPQVLVHRTRPRILGPSLHHPHHPSPPRRPPPAFSANPLTFVDPTALRRRPPRATPGRRALRTTPTREGTR